MSQKIIHGQQNQILKSRPMSQKVSTDNKTKFSKSSDVAKKCPRVTKPNFKSRPMSQKSVHE